jgi:acetylornithine deacetylase/succinyl-diaminopimelate desuccinylase-like protein
MGNRGLQERGVEVLRELLRFDTVNPPGAERPAIEFLQGLLEEAGFECVLLWREDESRPNLVARLTGHAPGPTLGYLGHVDTVLATPDEWSRGPWSGDVADGHVWGRGALDMKSQVAAEVTAATALAHEGWRPARGDLLVMCVVDEETGGYHGAQFLTEEHPDAVRCDFLLNEGGGAVIPVSEPDRRFYTVGCAEKGVFRFTVTAEGVAGHASMPKMGDNALLKLAPLIERMRKQPAFDLTDEPRALLTALGEDVDGDPAAALERVRERDPALAFVLEPTLGVTLTPTRVGASEKVNVIPSRAYVKVDCRVPPGLGAEDARRRIVEVLGADGYAFAFDDEVPGNRSPMQSVLMDAITEWAGEEEPGAAGVVPTVLPGFTDSRWFRVAFPEIVAYGFFPHRYMSLYEVAPLIHSRDERIDVRDMGVATDFYAWLPGRLLG